MTALAELFPDEDYRFQLGLRRGDARDFFAPADASGRVLAERRRWLAEAPRRHAGLNQAGVAVWEEARALGQSWGSLPSETLTVAEAGALWEPDFLLLRPRDDGQFVLVGGALCFPTGWALEEKMGRPVAEIHGPVPGLNEKLGPQIDQFLGRLKPGAVFFRQNWGIAATDELNLHPARELEGAVPPVDLQRLWLRVEHQVFVPLPRTRGIVFAIRIALHRLDNVAVDREAAHRLARALRTMPAPVAMYKRIEGVRMELAERLDP